jgi:hypothetical protein
LEIRSKEKNRNLDLFRWTKAKKDKVLTRRPKPDSLEKTLAVPASEKMEIEYCEDAPLASEIILVATVEATVGPVKEIKAKNSKT